jgi:ParB family chromosome partitioning protein
VAVGSIVVRGRLRPVTDAGVESLMASIAETGVMKDAVDLRLAKDGSLVLIAGGHRVEAARRLGWAEVPAKVWSGVSDDWARIMEIDDNLAGAEMNALDTAVFLATRKAVYERLHPETRQATGAALAARRWHAADTMSVAFVTSTAEKFGLSDRHVRRIAAAGARLGPDEVQRLRQAPRAVGLKDLMVIGRIGSAAERYDVVGMLAEGRARSAAEALRLRTRAADGAAAVAAPVAARPGDAAVAALLAAWARAPQAARRRFVAEAFEALSPLVVDEAEARDEADIAALAGAGDPA